MQTKKKSITEALVNTLSGLIIAFLIQVILFPLMDIPVRVEQNVLITLIFTAASILRSYLIRRIFNSIK